MLLLISHLLILATCLVLKIICVDESFIGYFFVTLSFLAVVAYLMKMSNIKRSMRIVILLGFVLRVVLVIIDVYLMRIVDAGTDDDGFYNASMQLYENNYEGFSSDVYGGVFSKLLSVSYFFIGSSRLSAQYLNVLLYVVSAILFVKAMLNFNISDRVLKISTIVFCLLPIGMMNNSVLRRETIMEVCICASLLFFSRWHVDKRLLYAIYTIGFIALASLFHTALIFAAVLFVAYFALYDVKKQKVSFSINKLSKMIILLICVIVAGMSFLSLWSNKLTSVSDMDDIYTTASRARGGSVYLEGYEINSFGELVLFSPLKLFYFLFSPVPWNFRGIMDVISFLFDALVYFVLMVSIFRAPKDSPSKLLLNVFIVLSLIFALGTFNSGTALRHRFTLLPYLLLSYSIVETKKTMETKSVKTTSREYTKLPLGKRRGKA